MREANRCYPEGTVQSGRQFYLRFVYDNEDIKLPFCEDVWCRFDEWEKHVSKDLFFDLSKAEDFCNSEHVD